MTGTQAAETASGKGEPALAKLPLMRRAMVRRMVQGAEVPCFYLRLGADVTEVTDRRRELKATGADPVPSLNDFVVRAAGIALRRHTDVNSSFIDGEIASYPRVNVGVAIAIPGGLVVPAVYDADRRDVHAIAASIREAVDLAQRRKLSRELLEDATFTVSNLGMYGIEEFDALINPPHAAILAVGAALPDAQGRLRMRMTLGCDHRVLTGAEGAPFLVTIRDLLERPEALLGAVQNLDEALL